MPGDATPYKIKLRNRGSSRCDAKVEVDGVDAGTFRINGGSSVTLERPSNVAKKFTFYRGGSAGAAKAGYSKGRETNGLVKVTFIAEKDCEVFLLENDNIGLRTFCAEPKGLQNQCTVNCSYSPGITGLSGTSSQKFNTVGGLLNTKAPVIIQLRLVADDNDIVPMSRNAVSSTPYPPLPCS